tara:strand:+ start:204 stop:761 length:558 start_codon:yes stop_codon:yes gene_type:complete
MHKAVGIILLLIVGGVIAFICALGIAAFSGVEGAMWIVGLGMIYLGVPILTGLLLCTVLGIFLVTGKKRDNQNLDPPGRIYPPDLQTPGQRDFKPASFEAALLDQPPRAERDRSRDGKIGWAAVGIGVFLICWGALESWSLFSNSPIFTVALGLLIQIKFPFGVLLVLFGLAELRRQNDLPGGGA